MKIVKLFCALLVFALSLSLFFHVAIGAESGDQNEPEFVNIIMDGELLVFSATPQLIGERTLAPMNEFLDAMNAVVSWDDETQTLILFEGDGVVVMQIGNSTASANGMEISIDVPPTLINDNVYIPVRIVAESLSASVDWDGSNKTVIITSGEPSVKDSSENISTVDTAIVQAPVIDKNDESIVFATLNSAEVKKYEFKYFYTSIKAEFLNSGGVEPGGAAEEDYLASPIDDTNTTTINDYLKEVSLSELKKYKILQLLANKRGTTPDVDARGYIDEIMSSSNYGGEDELAADIELNTGMSLDAYFNMYAQINLNEKFFDEEIEFMDVSEDDAFAEYEQNADMLTTVTVRHILFMYNGESGDRSEDESLKMAEDILAKLEAGEDMTTLAAEYSEDPAVVENGGEYTFDKNAGFVPEFIDWGFSAKVGDFGIIETDYGYHVMRLESIDATSFEDVKDDIMYWMRENALYDYLNQFLVDPEYELIVDEAVFATM